MTRRIPILLWLPALLLGTLLLLLVGASVWLAREVDARVPAQLAQSIEYMTGGLYRLESGRIRSLPLGRQIELSDVKIVLDTARFRNLQVVDSVPDRLFSLKMKTLRIAGIRWEDLWLHKALYCTEIILEGLEVKVETGLGRTPFVLRKPRNRIQLSGMTVQNLRADNLDFYLLHHTRNATIAAFSRDGVLQGSSLNWGLRGLPSFRNLTLTLGATALKLPDTRNEYSARGWQVDLRNFVFRMQGFRFRQRLPDTVVAVRNQLDIELLEMSGFRKITDTPADFFTLQNLKLYGPRVTATIVRRPGAVAPLTPKLFPQQLLQQAGLPLFIDTTEIAQGAVTYEETEALAHRTGTVYFNELSGTIRSLALGPLPENLQPEPIEVALNGQFQNRSLMTVQARFDTRDPLQGFTLSGSISRLQARQINDVAANLGRLRILRLQLDSMRFGFRGNRDVIHNTLQAAYHDLAVQLLRYDTVNKSLRQQPMLSLLANQLLLNPANPCSGKSLRVVETEYLRPATQPFFSALWRTLFEGIKEVVIADLALLNYVRQKAATRQQRKDERLQRREDRKQRREARGAQRILR